MPIAPIEPAPYTPAPPPWYMQRQELAPAAEHSNAMHDRAAIDPGVVGCWMLVMLWAAATVFLVATRPARRVRRLRARQKHVQALQQRVVVNAAAPQPSSTSRTPNANAVQPVVQNFAKAAAKLAEQYK